MSGSTATEPDEKDAGAVFEILLLRAGLVVPEGRAEAMVPGFVEMHARLGLLRAFASPASEPASVYMPASIGRQS